MIAISARLGLRSRQNLWAAYRCPAVEPVSREFLALAQAESPQVTKNSVQLLSEGASLHNGSSNVTGLRSSSGAQCRRSYSKPVTTRD